MSLDDLMAAQTENALAFATAPHFASLVPLVDLMYDAAVQLGSPNHSPQLTKLLMVCHRDFLVAASQIIRGLPFDSHANTRGAVEAAKVALAIKRNRANVQEWLKGDLRQRRWDARLEGTKPEYLPPNRYPELDNEPLLRELQQYFGIASDSFIHFTPEFLGHQDFSETPTGDGKTSIGLGYFACERDILLHASCCAVCTFEYCLFSMPSLMASCPPMLAGRFSERRSISSATSCCATCHRYQRCDLWLHLLTRAIVSIRRRKPGSLRR